MDSKTQITCGKKQYVGNVYKKPLRAGRARENPQALAGGEHTNAGLAAILGFTRKPFLCGAVTLANTIGRQIKKKKFREISKPITPTPTSCRD